MRMKRVLNALCLTAILSGCGTALTCGSEFGAPPERALWCSSPGELGKLIRRAAPPEVPVETVYCVDTLGDRDCFAIAADDS